MIPRQWLKRIREVELRTIRLVEDLMAGPWHSVFKGRGMDFDEVREYQPGDEVRRIDWNVTARTGVTHIKKYVEEREMTVMILVDISASGESGSVERSKRELAAELTAVLAFSAARNNDNTGLLLFTDRTELFLRPGKGKRHVLRMIREVLLRRPVRRGTGLAAALHYLNRVLSRRAVVFLISDFLDTGFERALKVAARRHDLVAVTIVDPTELELPDLGWITFEDAETGQVVEMNSGSRKVRESFAASARHRMDSLRRLCAGCGIDTIELQTGQPYLRKLLSFFERRSRRQSL